MATKPSSKTQTADETGLSDLLGKLGLGSTASRKGSLPEPNPKLNRELEKSPFKIFRCIADLGYFAWTPQGTYRSLSSVTSSQEISDQVNLGGKPDRLVRIASIGLPKRFASLSPQEYENKYPHGQIGIACLHVAFQCRGVDHEIVDFVFGGSTLEMLATQDASSNFLVTKVEGTNVILVVKRESYVANYADLGFQFERLMTGGQMSDRHSLTSVQHMHYMQVDKFRVLFSAESDALYEGEPVELKAANPAYYGTRVMFQMISNGSPTLCQGVKSRGVLVDVRLESLGQVTNTALRSSDSITSLERRIVDGMKAIAEQMSNRECGQVFKVTFRSGQLHLSPVPATRGNVLLPPGPVVKDLIL